LLKAAEQAGFKVLVTTDKNMPAQQNLKSRTIAIVAPEIRNAGSYSATSEGLPLA
jgi:hypothetical protein